jgi:uncharacterized protein YbjT (DUF2867 family)
MAMKVLLFGGSGMVGQGVLLECLRDPRVVEIVSIVRSPTGHRDPKLREIVLADIARSVDIAADLEGFDACFYCLGVSALGMSEAEYTRITYDLTTSIASALVPFNPMMTFVYVTGSGTDTGSRMMWARVKGRTEAALTALPFKAVYLFRPGFIQPLDGIVSKTGWYRILYATVRPISAPLLSILPAVATTTERVGRAMIAVASAGYPRPILENRDINRAGNDPAA